MLDSNFKTFDYILFGLSLCIPMSISLYVGYFQNKQKTASEYLYGKHNLSAWSAGLSLYSGIVSSLAILGTATEVYIFGTQFLVVALGSFASTFIIWAFILPVFCGNLNLKTPYEYFEYRFDKNIRMMMSALVLINSISCTPIVLYTSTVSFSQAAELPLVLCTTTVGTICTIYTLIGGFIGVIWTDVIQASLMLFSCVFVMLNGVNASGGFSKVWSIANEGNRIEFFNFNPNPFERLSFWSAFLGMCTLNTAFAGCSAKALQRFMAVNSEKAARISIAIGTVGYGVLIVIAGIIGVCIYAFYNNCDPILNKQISSPSHLLPFFINNIAEYIPGFMGFFTAGLLNAGLSSISADMNVASGLIYFDFLQKIFKTNKWKLQDIFFMKLIVIIYGVIIMLLAPMMARSKYVFEVALSAGSLAYGPISAVTLLGTSFPRTNAKGTFWGIITSVLLTGWISYNALNIDLSSKYALPLSTENCTKSHNNFTDFIRTTSVTIFESSISTLEENEPFILFKLSYMYYTAFGMIVTILVAILVSKLTGENDVNTMNPNLIIPRLRPKNKNVDIHDEIGQL